jgi:hypothetical protein
MLSSKQDTSKLIRIAACREQGRLPRTLGESYLLCCPNWQRENTVAFVVIKYSTEIIFPEKQFTPKPDNVARTLPCVPDQYLLIVDWD